MVYVGSGTISAWVVRSNPGWVCVVAFKRDCLRIFLHVFDMFLHVFYMFLHVLTCSYMFLHVFDDGSILFVSEREEPDHEKQRLASSGERFFTFS